MTSRNFKAQLNRQTVAEQLITSLRHAIISGELAEGEILTESALSKQLGTSRSPVREAIQQLRRERLITPGPNRMMIVTSLNVKDVDELYEYRIALEKTSIAKLCRQNEPDRSSVAHQLENALLEIKAALENGDIYLISSADFSFHEVLVTSAGNGRISEAYRALSAEFLTLINRLEMSFPSGEELIDDHYELVDAIRSGEPLRGVSLIENHLKSAASRLRTRFKTTEQEI